MFLKKNKDKRFGEYPCIDYLRNALRFIEDGEYEDAYAEILWAICKSGTGLEPDEIKWLKDSIYAKEIEKNERS